MALVGKLGTKSGLFRWHSIVFSGKIQRKEQTFSEQESIFSRNFITFAPNLKHFTTYGKYK